MRGRVVLQRICMHQRGTSGSAGPVCAQTHRLCNGHILRERQALGSEVVAHSQHAGRQGRMSSLLCVGRGMRERGCERAAC
eukprot:210265-Pelagomonas_calceolata.AAC.5